MVSRFTKHKIVDVLHAIAEGEIKAEYSRQALAEKYSFEPYTAFKRIALAPSLNITSSDLREFLLDNKIHIDSNDAFDLIKLFDTDRDGKLSYSEFLNAVLPKTDSSLRYRATSRQAYDLEEGGRLPYDVEYALARLLEEELNSFKQAEQLKKELSYSYDYTTSRAFGAADFDNKGYLSPDDIADLADELSRTFSEKSTDALFRKVDLDHDGRISYSEFANAVSYPKTDVSTIIPSSPRRRSASPRRSRDTEVKKSYESPTKASPFKAVLKDSEYRDYLSESKRRSASPRRGASPRRVQAEEKEIYRTPTRSPRRLEESTVSSRKKSPLRALDEEELAQAFKKIINSTKLLESTKNDLAIRSDFNLFDAFRYIDFDGTGAFATAKQFEEGLADLKLFPTKDEVSLLFKKFGRDYYGYFRFNDFSTLLTPKAKEYASLLDSRKPRYVEPDEEIFTRETERLFTRVLDLALENEVLAESLRQKLSRRPLFNNYDAFKAIDKYDQGFIVLEDLKEILEDNGIFATNRDVNLLVDHFKGKEDKSGKISYSEFTKEMSPKSYRVY